MAAIYGEEVPAYTTLVAVSEAVNADAIARDRSGAQRLGSIERVTAERHGAIRLGTSRELREVSRVFAALGMYPVGFYDLREAATDAAVPVVSTAFRPVEGDELAANPFRMFTSLLVTDDRRFFSADLQGRLDRFLARRMLFQPGLLALAERAITAAGLPDDAADRFLDLATEAFSLSPQPINQAWYAELEAVSAVAADIGAVTSTHINHLTPRVLDIDDLYRRMGERGIAMIDAIQGPPKWDGPDVLLRQTSFRALDERRTFRQKDGTLQAGTLRVRFGEVEARGIALTRAGRDRYDALLAEIDRRCAADGAGPRPEIAAEIWREGLPDTELGLLREGLGFFAFAPGSRSQSNSPSACGTVPCDASPAALAAEVEAGRLTATPIVYEDFLPRSAAGIFQSNLTEAGMRNNGRTGSRRDAAWLSDVLGAELRDPFDLYAAQQRASLDSPDRPAHSRALSHDDPHHETSSETDHARP
jgi:uncharacterized glyoxalase superfamily metalloenzyme YdcJ